MTTSTILRNDALTEEAVALLQSRMKGFEELAYQRLLEFLRRFETKGGKFVPGETSTALLLEIKKEVASVLKVREYSDAATEFVANFDAIADNVRAVHGEQNGIVVPKSLVNPSKRYAIDATLYALKDANVHPKFIEPVRKALFNHINFGQGVSEAHSVLRTMILGNKEFGGALSQWIGQVAVDAIAQYEGVVQTAIAKEHGLTGLRYVNSLIATSRAQCVRWVKKEWISEAELPKEIEWAKEHGSGMIEATVPDTFLIYRGGHRCRHKALPVRDSLARKMSKEQPPNPAPKPTGTKEEVAVGRKSFQPWAPRPEAPALDGIPPAPRPPGSAPLTGAAAFDARIPPANVLSTRSAKMVKAMKEIIAAQDGALEIAANRGTIFLLRSGAEKGAKGGQKLLEKTKSNYTGFHIGTMTSNSNGNAARNNAYVNVALKSDEVLEFGAVDMVINAETKGVKEATTRSGEPVLVQGSRILAYEVKDKWKPFSVSTMSKKNRAPTVTHEVAHLIHNLHDPNLRPRLSEAAKAAKVTLNDAPTYYGQTNWSEFWAETFTSYVYANAWLKKEHLSVFNLFEAVLKEYGIDKASIAITKEPEKPKEEGESKTKPEPKPKRKTKR